MHLPFVQIIATIVFQFYMIYIALKYPIIIYILQVFFSLFFVILLAPNFTLKGCLGQYFRGRSPFSYRQMSSATGRSRNMFMPGTFGGGFAQNPFGSFSPFGGTSSFPFSTDFPGSMMGINGISPFNGFGSNTGAASRGGNQPFRSSPSPYYGGLASNQGDFQNIGQQPFNTFGGFPRSVFGGMMRGQDMPSLFGMQQNRQNAYGNRVYSTPGVIRSPINPGIHSASILDTLGFWNTSLNSANIKTDRNYAALNQNFHG